MIATLKVASSQEHHFAEKVAEYVEKHAEKGSPQSVLNAIDKYANTKEPMMNVGDEKGPIVDQIITENKPKIVVEIGGYIGYSAVRFGALIRDLNPSARYYSFEFDPAYVTLMRKNIALAGLEETVTVIEGAFSEKGHDFLQKHNLTSVDMVFIDHWKDLYLPDLKNLEKWKYFHKGTVIVADNIICPGAPDYAKYVSDATDKYDTKMIKTYLEYSKQKVADALAVSVWKLD